MEKTDPKHEKDTYTAFDGHQLVATASVRPLLRRAKEWLAAHNGARLLFFEDRTGKEIDFDLRGSVETVLDRLDSHPVFAPPPTSDARGPGRPKLGVVSREVSLLPRHWEFLEQQPSGISAALRRLIEVASKQAPEKARARLALEAVSRVMTALAGDLPGFEEASRALFARDLARFEALISAWPKDVRKHLTRLMKVAAALEAEAALAPGATAPAETGPKGANPG